MGKISSYLFLILTAIFFFACEKEDIAIRHDHTIPVIEIDIDEKYLWSPDSGLYVIGNNGIAKNCMSSFPANYNQDWEFPAIIRFFPQSGSDPAFEERAGFRIKGNCSREKSMKSIGLYWRGEYGNSSLSYPIFPGSSNMQYKRLLLRNSGNDFGLTQLKDGAVINLIKEHARVDYQDYRPVILYLNGEYWGIHNLREMITPQHFRYHYGVDADRVEILEGSPLSPEIDDGTDEAFLKEVVAFIENNDLSVPANYQYLTHKIDMGNLVDYIIIETYVGNRDWPVTNSKWWRENRNEGEYNTWRWIAFDHDLAFTPGFEHHFWLGDMYGEPLNRDKEPGFFIFNHLILNNEFRKEFLSRYEYFLDNVFDPDRVETIISGMKSTLEEEYPRHMKKWHTLPLYRWKSSVNKVIEVNRKRHEVVKEIIEALHEDS